ncbi:MAG: threonine synthase [Bryobacterales bacterium]|nr:threonine synthase [Bryobacterales bacterium]
MTASRSTLRCHDANCRKRYELSEVIYSCATCGSLLEVFNSFDGVEGSGLRELWQERRLSRRRIDVSGVWRFREMLPFVTDERHIVTLPEGNTPLFEAPAAAAYAGLDGLQFKHQGYNPTASFKDNGMTAGVTQARVLGMQRVACVSTGNTSASMAAYAAAADMQAVIFLPAGKIAYGKLAQALEYGALTIQVEANFDRILALVRELAVALGIYVLNSVNPFRIEGQKSIVIEMLEQRGWRVPDWIVLPGGNLGNISALGKGLRELRQLGLIDSLPRVAVIQAEGSAPFHAQFRDGGELRAVRKPETLATAIRIGDPVSWRKAAFEVGTVHGVVESVTEQEIADAKAVIGRCGIGCEPASAATLAGIRKLVKAGAVKASAEVAAILTGHLLKDPDYVYRYHSGQLETPSGQPIRATFGNAPITVGHDRGRIAELLERYARPA